jgi:hypothetical protein
LVFVEGFGEIFATTVCLGAGFGIGFGVAFGFGVGGAVDFGLGVDADVGFGVGDGNSISLFAVIRGGVSSSGSSSFRGFASTGGGACLGAGDVPSSDSPVATPSALPNQTILSGFGGTLAATLQRISPAMSAACARAMRTTFRQKRLLAAPWFCEGGSFAIYFSSAFVAMPTFVMPSRRSASIIAINFCTGSSRSGRMTIATSGSFCFNSPNCAVSVSKSTT